MTIEHSLEQLDILAEERAYRIQTIVQMEELKDLNPSEQRIFIRQLLGHLADKLI